MPFVDVKDPVFDPEPPGFAAVANPQFDQEPEEISPGETFAQNAINVFGAGPALVGAVNYVARGMPYAQTRDAFRQRMATSAEQNPKSAIAGRISSIVPETILGGAAGKAVEAGAGAIGLAGKAAPFVAANPIISNVLEHGIAGAGYGAASGAGEALSEGKDIGEGAAKGAAGGAVVGAAFGGVVGGITKAAKGAVERADSALLPGVTDAVTKDVRSEVVSALRKDPELLKIASKPTAEAIEGLTERASKLTGTADELISQIDSKSKGIPIGKFAAAIDDEIARLGKKPLQEGLVSTLEQVKDSALKTWVPEDLAALLASPAAKESKTGLAENLLKRRDAAPVPMARIEELNRAISENLKAPEEVKAHISNIVRSVRDAHVTDVAAKSPEIKGAIDSLRGIDKELDIVATLTGALKDKPAADHGSLDKLISLFTHHGPIGAAISLASGHPIPAAILAAPAAARKGTELLAWLQREAAAGNQKAIRAVQTANVAESIGTAASGAVGSAKSGMLTQTEAPQ